MTPQFAIEEKEVQIWIADLAKQGQDFIYSLSLSEKARASRFHFRKDRDIYERARGILRFLLGRYLSAPPEKIEILTTELGKPYVAESLNGQTLAFNLSHSGGIAVYGFCLNHPVGIDVEVLRPIPDLDRLAARFFSANEKKSLRSVGSQTRAKLFLQYWTRKEACLKALGLGLRISPEEVDVASAPVPANQLTPFQPQIKSDQNSWSLMDFYPTENGVAAIMVDANAAQITITPLQET